MLDDVRCDIAPVPVSLPLIDPIDLNAANVSPIYDRLCPRLLSSITIPVPPLWANPPVILAPKFKNVPCPP